MSSLDILNQFIGNDAEFSLRPRGSGISGGVIEDMGENLLFGDGSRYVDALRQSRRHQGLVGSSLLNLRDGGSLVVGATNDFNFKATASFSGPLRDVYLGLYASADSPELAEAILGSYHGNLKILQIDPANNRTQFQVTIENSMSLASVPRIPGHYGPGWDARVNGANDTLFFQTVNMTVVYTEWHYGVS